MRMRLLVVCAVMSLLASGASAQPKTKPAPRHGDRMIAKYFAAETDRLSSRCLADIHTREQWEAQRGELRRQLFEMLGLDPLPPRTDLKAKVTDKIDYDGFTVEMLHFQSRPGLYVTANLYLPRGASAETPAPVVLYLCGHGIVKKGDVSYGNKTYYQHHAIWFARHGYACLVLDTLQLGEIEGIHHGTYRENMWWWNARGYTPAGVEAWNCVRALDYLQSRKEIDGSRIGVTGRSGGGAYSWWIAAIDDRIQAAVPVAGITDLHNHVVDGTVEGHCDCMFFVNTYGWDYATVAALVAPRPLLIANSDKDSIFPLDGVTRLYWKARTIYELYGAGDKLGLQISEGPHKDTQELQVAAFRWMNRFVKREDAVIERAALKAFEPEQLRVFDKLPADQINTRIHETFVPTAAAPKVSESADRWASQREEWLAALKRKVFAGWPDDPGPLDVTEAFAAERDGVSLRAYDFSPQPHVRLRLYVATPAGDKRPARITLNAMDDPGWARFLAAFRPGFERELKEDAGGATPDADPAAFDRLKRSLESDGAGALAYIAPRGVGPTAFNADAKVQAQTRRRFMLLGQTLEGQQAFDVRRAVQVLRSLPAFASSGDAGAKAVALTLRGDTPMASALALYATLFEPGVARLELARLPHTHMQPDAPHYLNVLRVLDVPQAVALAAERSDVRIETDDDPATWAYPIQTAKQLGWPDGRINVRRSGDGNP
jgi:dienelactone hydrolase